MAPKWLSLWVCYVGICVYGTRWALSVPVPTVLSDVLPASDVPLITSSLSDLQSLPDHVDELVTSLSNLRASTTSVASSLFTSQALFTQLLTLNDMVEQVKSMAGDSLTDEFSAVELAVKQALLDVASMGTSLSFLLTNSGGTTQSLHQLSSQIQSLGASLEALRPLDIDLHTAASELKDFALPSRSFNLGTQSLVIDGRTDLGRLGSAAFELVDDLSAGTSTVNGLTVSRVMDAVELRGGFELPVNMGLGTALVGNDFLSIQHADLDRLSVGGLVVDGARLSTDLSLPSIGGANLDVTNDLLADGELSVKDRLVNGQFVNDFDLEKNLNVAGVADLGLGHGHRNVLNGSIQNLNGQLSNVGSFGGGSGISSELLNGGTGFSGNSNLQQNIDLPNLTGDMRLTDNLHGGGGFSVGDALNIVGGANTAGHLSNAVDIKSLTAEGQLERAGGIGGAVGVLGQPLLSGGAGGTGHVNNAVDLANGTLDLDMFALTGTDGKITLPGNLGGLEYDINDLTDVKGHVDLKDLSNRSIQILKETNILTTVDLPGTTLESITLEAHPRLDLTHLGELNVLGFAEHFATSIQDITQFNMLTESNLSTAVASGVEFISRLDILDALRHEIGEISALPEVTSYVRLVLEDMREILVALRSVRVFPENVRLLGEALGRFDLSQLTVELPQLEALSVAAKTAVQDTAADAKTVAEEAATKTAEALPKAAAALAGFDLSNFLDAAAITEKVSSASLNFANLSSKVHGEELLNTNALSTVLKTVPAIASGVDIIASSTGHLQSTVGDLAQSVPDLPELDLTEIVSTANLHNIDLNDLSNVDELADLLQLDVGVVSDLEDLIRVANIQNVNLNQLVEMASLADLDINDLDGLSALLNVDLTTVDFDLLKDLSEGLPLADLDMQSLLQSASLAGIDITDVASIPAISELTHGLDVSQVAQLESLIRQTADLPQVLSDVSQGLPQVLSSGEKVAAALSRVGGQRRLLQSRNLRSDRR